MKEKEQESLTVYEVAERFMVAPPTIYQWIKKGLKTRQELLAGTRFRTMIKVEDVEEYLYYHGVQNGKNL